MSNSNENNHFSPLKIVNLHTLKHINESIVEKYLLKDLSVLKLGSLTVESNQRRYDNGSAISDIVAVSKVTNARYVIELQLGKLNPSHIVRLIEYWNYEKKQNPNTHIKAVLIAEECTRYIDVLQILQDTIPITVIQMVATELSDKKYGLFFTTIIREKGMDYDGDNEEKTEQDWITGHGQKTLEIIKSVFNLLQTEEVIGKSVLSLNYTKHYVGIMINGTPKNFIRFREEGKRIVRLCVKQEILTDDMMRKIHECEMDIGELSTDLFLSITQTSLSDEKKMSVIKEVLVNSYKELV